MLLLRARVLLPVREREHDFVRANQQKNISGVEIAKSKELIWRAVIGDPAGNRDLWERVAYWQERLRDCDNYPVLAGLESAWQVLSATYKGAIRRANDERCSDTPLAALFYYVEMGFYPPPELLLALHDAYQVYETSRGHISLEEVFFGPPRRKAGTYANRRAAWFQRVIWGIKLHRLIRKGHTKAHAAELVAEDERRIRIDALVKSGHTRSQAEAALSKRDVPEPETIARRALMPRFPKDARNNAVNNPRQRPRVDG